MAFCIFDIHSPTEDDSVYDDPGLSLRLLAPLQAPSESGGAAIYGAGIWRDHE
jgi:hypothetical protein